MVLQTAYGLPRRALCVLQVMRLNPEAVCAARTAEQQPSLLLRENSIQLLPGPLSQLTDDM